MNSTQRIVALVGRRCPIKDETMILGLHHLSLQLPADRQEEANRFYTNLGFQKLPHSPSTYQQGTLQVLLDFSQAKSWTPPTGIALAYSVSSLTEIQAQLKKMDLPYSLSTSATHPQLPTLEFRDPFGYTHRCLQELPTTSQRKPLGHSLGWETLAARTLYKSSWHTIRQDALTFRGHPHTYTYLEHPGAVFIVPVTAEHKVALIHTYRYTIDAWCWEVPAGGLGDQTHRSLEDAARAEMAEEAGYQGGKLYSLGTYYSANGGADLKVHYYLAYPVEKMPQAQPEFLEQISEVRELSWAECLQWAHNGTINDGDSAFALLLAHNRMTQFRTQKGVP